jgi:hypothetical protein
LSGKTNRKRIQRGPRKRESKRFHLRWLDQVTLARNGRQCDRGHGGRGRITSGTLPRKASDVVVCKDFEGHIFTIGSGNKGKDGDMLRTSMEKMATYIGTK